MESIPEVNLVDLVRASAEGILDERRLGVSGQIKQMLQKYEQLSLDVRSAEKALEQKKKSLEQHAAKVTKLRAGDWSVLTEAKEEAVKTD